MKKVAVFGIGRMGLAITHCMSRLGYYVIGVDSNENAAGDFRKIINSTPEDKNGIFYDCNKRNYKEIIPDFERPEVVISSLPFHQNKELAQFCIDSGVRYCDLGGRVDVSRFINQYATENANFPVMTDLGLAPGWVNILAEQGFSELHRPVESVEMMVGGLPANFDANPPLNYLLTWSMDGLINEYKDDCEVLVNGEIKTVEGMSGHEKIYIKLLGEELEAFCTSGGASHTLRDMQRRDVKNCFYKTLRFKGHRDIVHGLIKKANLEDDVVSKFFEKTCPPSPYGDIVIIRVVVRAGSVSFEKEIIVGYSNPFTAMQRATASPISAVAALMAEGVLDERFIERRSYKQKLSHVLTYKDIPFDKFTDNLELLEIQS
tara:strand:+ start:6957 stop:8081 length:1125 start_codon:yes stop_codon:yes gene_type:complete